MSHGAVSTNADGTVLALRARFHNARWIYVPPPSTTVLALTIADAPARIIAVPKRPQFHAARLAHPRLAVHTPA